MKLKKMAVGFACLGLASFALWQAGCEVTRTSDGDISIRPADGGKSRPIPPERIFEITINGVCYKQFKGRNGVWFCVRCDLVGDGYAEPCDQLINPDGPGDPSIAESFKEFIAELLVQEGVDPFSEDILDHFGLSGWTAGEIAPVPLAISLLDFTNSYAEVVVVGRSDWDWPDNTLASVEFMVFPESTGSLPDYIAGEHGAVAFRVSGSFTDVANAVASMFDSGFYWATEWSTGTGEVLYEVESTMLDVDTYLVEVIADGEVVWTNNM